MSFNIIVSKDENIKNAAFVVRTRVFIEEQGFRDEFDEIDGYAYHAAAFDGNKVIGSGRLFSEHDGNEYHIGRIAVLSEYRGMDVGRHIMAELEKKAAEIGACRIILSAQKRAKGFYERLGYTAYGDEYLDEGCPHIAMKKYVK